MARCEVPPNPKILHRSAFPGDNPDHVGGLYDGFFGHQQLSWSLFGFHVAELPAIPSLSRLARRPLAAGNFRLSSRLGQLPPAMWTRRYASKVRFCL